MTSAVIRTRKTPFLPANAYRKICGNFRNMSSLTRLISCGSVTGVALPPMDRPRGLSLSTLAEESEGEPELSLLVCFVAQ